METHNDESRPAVVRAGSPDMVFDNEFTDSGDENEEVTAFQMKEMLSSESKTPHLFNEHDILSAENVLNHGQFEDLETDTKFDSSSPRADTLVDQTLTQCVSDDVFAGSETGLLRHQNRYSNSDNFSSGWTLNEDDLTCLPLTLNTARIQEYKATTTHEQPTFRPHSDKGQKKNVMRLLKKRSGKGSPRIVYMSPLSMIVSFAKKNGYDLPTFLETSEFMGGPSLQLPCMQCYEKRGGKVGTDGLNSLMGALSGEAGSSNGRCSTCGGQVQTMASFGRMLRQMREVIEAKDLIPHDVYPDGNCLFAAIVDQLRVRGDFSFTTHSLRQSAVEYLRKNPTADDDTPLLMFLTDEESWESYLERMSEDGEWGDHIILSALANVINMQIVIYGGMTGQGETVLSPKLLTREDSKIDSEQNPVENGNVVYLGHVSESHYMSLRPKQWRQSLWEGLQKRRITLESSNLHAPVERSMIKCPVQHINFILRQVFRMDFIKSFNSEIVDMLVPSRFEIEDYVNEFFGSVICKMVPCKVKVDSLGPDISMFFPSVKEEDADGCFQTPTVTIFTTPNDTHVVTTMDSAGSTDVLAKNDASGVGRVLLIPRKPSIWKGQTASLGETTVCLKPFDLDNDFFDSFPPSNTKDSTEGKFDLYKILGFRSTWPDVAKEWSQRFRESDFPNQQTIQTVVELGCHVIPLIPDAKLADVLDDPVHFITSLDDHRWCYSFVAAEKEICRFLSSEQRQCFLIFSSLVDMILKDIPLPSSVAKSIFFYACEKLDNPYWKSKPGECLLILLKKIWESFKNRLVPHYFMREKNLLSFLPEKTLAECYYRLDCARLQPVVTLYFLLDQLNVISSEIGSFVEEIIENINVDDQTSTKVGPSNQTLLPACTELLQNLIIQEDFHGAMLVFQDIIEERGNTLMTDGVTMIKKLLWDIHIGHQWCFALYVDMKQQTTMTTQLCGGYEAVHVTEVFGPNCIEELPDTLLPECFSIRKGDLIFIRKVSHILSQNLSSKMYIECMKFYLKQYAELAGESLILQNNENELTRTSAEKTKTATFSCMCGSCGVSSPSNLGELQDIYVTLFNFCYQSYKTEEFREMMPVYTSIAERIGSRLCLTNLRQMWICLGERQKAADISQKMGTSTVGSVFGTLVGKFMGAGYDLD